MCGPSQRTQGMMPQGGRLCVAVAAGEGAPRGVVLGGGGPGGGLYLEPPAAVPLNNELAAARGAHAHPM